MSNPFNDRLLEYAMERVQPYLERLTQADIENLKDWVMDGDILAADNQIKLWDQEYGQSGPRGAGQADQAITNIKKVPKVLVDHE